MRKKKRTNEITFFLEQVMGPQDLSGKLRAKRTYSNGRFIIPLKIVYDVAGILAFLEKSKGKKRDPQPRDDESGKTILSAVKRRCEEK
ncbi:hypothetical protein TNCV_2778151 [Trichonephila clavipes]|nr:hypothetical protein TNCV_2778151 [Trichonephila clavipes]